VHFAILAANKKEWGDFSIETIISAWRGDAAETISSPDNIGQFIFSAALKIIVKRLNLKQVGSALSK